MFVYARWFNVFVKRTRADVRKTKSKLCIKRDWEGLETNKTKIWWAKIFVCDEGLKRTYLILNVEMKLKCFSKCFKILEKFENFAKQKILNQQ